MLIQACVAAGVPRIVHLSVTNASEDSALPYFRGKGILERAIRESTLSYAILRPALIFGPGDVLVNNIAWFLRHAPVFAIMGDGRYKLQCVGIDDVAEIAAHAAGRAENLVMDVVGPETFTFDGFVRIIAENVRSHARIINLPAAVVQVLLGVAGIVVRDVILTRHEITGLMGDLLVSRSAPAGRSRFSDWLREHAPDLGRTYNSELRRHYR
jgi:NADH dehydrogenase